MQKESGSSHASTNGQDSGLAPGAAANVDAALSGMSREFHSFIADVEDLVKATTSLTGEELSKAKTRLSERVAAAKESVGEMGGAISNRARMSAVATNTYVREQPWKAIGAGAAIGFLLGYVLARRA